MMVLLCPQELLDRNIVGKVCIVTGGNSGIGLETVKQLAKQGATVVFTVRDIKVGKALEEEINAKNDKGNKVEAMRMDLSDLSSVKSFANEFKQKYKSLHILINNAGVMNVTPKQLSKDGYEMQFATNHLGHFLLTNLLLDTLKASKPSRVVCVSSCFHVISNGRKAFIDFKDPNYEKRPYDGWEAYGQSKLANVLHARELAKRLEVSGVSAVSLHPGTQTTLFCALDPSIENNNGKYYSQDGIYPRNPKNGWPMESQNEQTTDENAAKLWELSAKLAPS